MRVGDHQLDASEAALHQTLEECQALRGICVLPLAGTRIM